MRHKCIVLQFECDYCFRTETITIPDKDDNACVVPSNWTTEQVVKMEGVVPVSASRVHTCPQCQRRKQRDQS